MNENRCVCCGQIIPEGSMVCIACQKEYQGYEKHVTKAQKRRETIRRLIDDWIVPLGIALLIICGVYALMRYGWW